MLAPVNCGASRLRSPAYLVFRGWRLRKVRRRPRRSVRLARRRIIRWKTAGKLVRHASKLFVSQDNGLQLVVRDFTDGGQMIEKALFWRKQKLAALVGRHRSFALIFGQIGFCLEVHFLPSDGHQSNDPKLFHRPWPLLLRRPAPRSGAAAPLDFREIHL